MAEINLMDRYPKTRRPINERGAMKLQEWNQVFVGDPERTDQALIMEQLLLRAVRKFDREYFDGDRLYGYGGYHYHPRFWVRTVRRFRDHYQLAEDARVLDVGCAKGFLLHDFKRLMPRCHVAGLDISPYAYAHATEDVKPFITVGNAKHLPYPDRSFDLVVSINTVDHLPVEDCATALKEIQRVARKHAFVTVNSWRNEHEKENLVKWSRTLMTLMDVKGWKQLFRKVGYTGDYYWFIAA